MLEIIEYPKIPGPFKREVSGVNKNKVIPWAWTSPELELLADVPWRFTEKVDGTNIRVIWDGHKPEFRGRTDRANLPPKLITTLIEMFPEELFEQKFSNDSVILFGEGYGAGIQKGGGNYRQDNSFILFDVKIGDWWLKFEDVLDIARSLGVDCVPIYFQGTLRNAIQFMAEQEILSYVSEIGARGREKAIPVAEGMVGQPKIPLFNRNGERIIVKLKGCDLLGLDVS